MTNKELVENFKKLKEYAINSLIDDSDVLRTMRDHNNKITDDTISIYSGSQRWNNLLEIGDLLNYDNAEQLLYTHIDNLITEYNKLLDEDYNWCDKEARHWKREGYESKDNYYDYLIQDLYYAYADAPNCYDRAVIENFVKDTAKVLNKDLSEVW